METVSRLQGARVTQAVVWLTTTAPAPPTSCWNKGRHTPAKRSLPWSTLITFPQLVNLGKYQHSEMFPNLSFRDSSAGYNSVERLLPPYPCPPAPPHRKSNGVTGGGFDISSSVHARLDNPHSYSYSFSNISDMQPGKSSQDRLDTTQLAHAHCCSSQAGRYS